jgi:hypothetical protein
VNGEPVMERTWADPNWGPSLLFVDELRLTWYQHLQENWRVPAAIAAVGAVGALLMPFILMLAPGTGTQKVYYFAFACLLFPFYFIRFWQDDRQRQESPHYLEVFRSGLYFWLHGFENGAHPFASFERIKTVRWRQKGNQCLFELTVCGFSRVVELSIDKVDVTRILSLIGTDDAKQTPFLAVLQACIKVQETGQDTVTSA